MELIERVKEAQKVLDDAQKELLVYCRDKSQPLNARWSAWTKYASKEERSYIGCSGSKILSDIIDKWSDNREMDRHETVSYTWLLDSVCESPKMLQKIQNICVKHTTELRDKKIDMIINDGEGVSGSASIFPQNMEELKVFMKEEIMVANFGSFEYDW